MSRPFRAKNCLYPLPRALPWAGMSNPLRGFVVLNERKAVPFFIIYLLSYFGNAPGRNENQARVIIQRGNCDDSV